MPEPSYLQVSFFLALDTGTTAETTPSGATDQTEFLRTNRGIAIMLLLMCVSVH